MSCTGIYDLLLKYFPDNNMCHPGKCGGTHLSEACTYPLLRLTSKFCSMFQLWYHLKERELLWESVPSPLIYWVRPACKRHIPGEHHSLSLSEASRRGLQHAWPVQSASVLQSPNPAPIAGGLVFFLGTYTLQPLPNLAWQQVTSYIPGLQVIFGVLEEDFGQAHWTTFLASAM